MEHDTEHTATRVSTKTAREAAARLRAALETLDIHTTTIRQIIPATDINGGAHIRMGTWDPEDVHALADSIEALRHQLS